MGMRTLGFPARAWSWSLRLGDGVKFVKKSGRRVVVGGREKGEGWGTEREGESVIVIFCDAVVLRS